MPSEDAKTVKKERVKGEDEETLDSLKKKKPNNATQKEAKARKEETKRVKKEGADEDFEQSPPKKSSNKSSDKVQKKRKKEEEIKKKGAKETEQTAKKREKKVYDFIDLPGQRRDPPEERDPLRIFYETLYKQVPNSEMAAIWMMESGLLPKEAAKKIFEKKQKKAQQQKVKSPVKAVGTVKRKADSVTIKKKTSTSPVSTQKKRTLDSKVGSKQSKKCKIADSSSKSGSDDDDYILKAKNSKKQEAG